MSRDRAAGPQTLATTIAAALDRLARAQRTFRQAVASEQGLTPLQLEILTTIAAGPPPEPLVGLLAKELGVSQPTITDAVRALEQKGLLQRRTDALDRRRAILMLTRRGARVVERVHADERRIVDAIAAAPLDAQEHAVEALLGLIARFVDAGIIDVARTCATCRFHESSDGRHRCTLLDIELRTTDLRVNCPEHEPQHAA